MPALQTDAHHAPATLLATGGMALTTVALILLTLFGWYPRTVL